MKTIFKIGMEVYDSLNFPKISGVVVDIKDYENVKHIYPIVVRFGNEERFYTTDGRLSFGGTKTLATSPYSVKFKDFKQLGKVTEEDAIKWLISTKGLKSIHLVKVNSEVITYESKEMYDSFEALRKLILLRDYYNEGWKPDWNDFDQLKYSIEYYRNELGRENYTHIKKLLSFRSPKIRDRFFEEQKELLEIAKHLI